MRHVEKKCYVEVGRGPGASRSGCFRFILGDAATLVSLIDCHVAHLTSCAESYSVFVLISKLAVMLRSFFVLPHIDHVDN